MGTSRDSLGLPDNCTAPIFNRLGVVFSQRSLKNSPRRDHQAEWSPVQDLLAGRMGRLISRRGWTDMLSGGPLNPISYLSEGELSCVPQSSTSPARCSLRLCTCHQTRNGPGNPLKVECKKMETDANSFPLRGTEAELVTLKCRCFSSGLCVCHGSSGEKKCPRMWCWLKMSLRTSVFIEKKRAFEAFWLGEMCSKAYGARW